MYRALQDASACAARFRASALVRRLWPPALRERTMASFEWRGLLDLDYEAATRPAAIADLWAALERSRLRTLPLLLMDSEPRLAVIARARHAEGERHPVLAFHMGAAALAERDYPAAARFFEEVGSASVGFHSPVLLRGVALGLARRRAEAGAVVASVPPTDLPPHAVPWRDWLSGRVSVPTSSEAIGALRP